MYSWTEFMTLTILIEILPFCNGLDKFTYLNSTFLVKVKLTSISYAACSNTCAYNNTMVESLKKKTFCSRQDCIFRRHFDTIIPVYWPPPKKLLWKAQDSQSNYLTLSQSIILQNSVLQNFMASSKDRPMPFRNNPYCCLPPWRKWWFWRKDWCSCCIHNGKDFFDNWKK